MNNLKSCYVYWRPSKTLFSSKLTLKCSSFYTRPSKALLIAKNRGKIYPIMKDLQKCVSKYRILPILELQTFKSSYLYWKLKQSLPYPLLRFNFKVCFFFFEKEVFKRCSLYRKPQTGEPSLLVLHKSYLKDLLVMEGPFLMGHPTILLSLWMISPLQKVFKGYI